MFTFKKNSKNSQNTVRQNLIPQGTVAASFLMNATMGRPEDAERLPRKSYIDHLIVRLRANDIFRIP